DGIGQQLRLVDCHGEPLLAKRGVLDARAGGGSGLCLGRGMGRRRSEQRLLAVALDGHDAPAPRRAPETHGIVRTVLALTIDEEGDRSVAPYGGERPPG